MTKEKVKEFMTILRLEDKAAETLRTYGKAITKYESYLATNKLKPDTDSMMSFLVRLKDKEKLRPSTIKLYMIILKRYFKFLGETFPKIKIPKLSLGPPKFIEKDDFIKLYDASATDPKLRAELSVAYSSAMRITELVTRKVQDLDLEAARIFVSGKTGPESDSWLPLSPTAIKDLNEYLAYRASKGYAALQNDDFLFPRHEDGKVQTSKSSLTVELYGLCKKAGIKRCSWHIIRHTRATHLREDGTRMEDIQVLLRHGSPNTTARYARSDTEKLRKAINDKDVI